MSRSCESSRTGSYISLWANLGLSETPRYEGSLVSRVSPYLRGHWPSTSRTQSVDTSDWESRSFRYFLCKTFFMLVRIKVGFYFISLEQLIRRISMRCYYYYHHTVRDIHLEGYCLSVTISIGRIHFYFSPCV